MTSEQIKNTCFLKVLRRRRNWDEKFCRLYQRHRWQIEGRHGDAKTQHDLRRAVRRGLSNVAIQVYLTAAVMNLKRLAAFLLLILAGLKNVNGHFRNSEPFKLYLTANFLWDRRIKNILKSAA